MCSAGRSPPGRSADRTTPREIAAKGFRASSWSAPVAQTVVCATIRPVATKEGDRRSRVIRAQDTRRNRSPAQNSSRNRVADRLSGPRRGVSQSQILSVGFWEDFRDDPLIREETRFSGRRGQAAPCRAGSPKRFPLQKSVRRDLRTSSPRIIRANASGVAAELPSCVALLCLADRLDAMAAERAKPWWRRLAGLRRSSWNASGGG